MLSDRLRDPERDPGTSLTKADRNQALNPRLAAPQVPPALELALDRPRPSRARAWVIALALLLLGGYSGYMLLVAPAQYVVDVRFAVRNADTSRMMPMVPGMGGGMGGGATDSYAVVNFLRSADAMRELDEHLDMQELFGNPGIDWFSRLPEDATPEQLQRYLAPRIRPYFDHTSGIVSVELRAYRAADAFALARAVEALSENLVNRMSLGARRGLLSAIESEVQAAERRLSEARDALRDFREENQMVDPRRAAEAESMLRARLESEIASLNAELQAMLRFSAAGSPQVTNLRNRLEALQQESRNVQARSASADPAALTAAIRGFETLETNVMVAQRAYEALLQTLERTRGEAGRQQLYLAHIVRPTLPAEPILPRRWENIATAAALLAVASLLLLLVLRTVREHLN